MRGSRGGCAEGAGGDPSVGCRIVFPAGVKIVRHTTIIKKSAPDNHSTASPNCSVGSASTGRVRGRRARPIVSTGIVLAASVENVHAADSPPANLYVPLPNCGAVILDSCGPP